MARRKKLDLNLTDPAVRRAAELVVAQYPPKDMARQELREGVFDLDMLDARDVFDALVAEVRRNACSPN